MVRKSTYFCLACLLWLGFADSAPVQANYHCVPSIALDILSGNLLDEHNPNRLADFFPQCQFQINGQWIESKNEPTGIAQVESKPNVGAEMDTYWQYYADCDRWGVLFGPTQFESFRKNAFQDSRLDWVTPITNKLISDWEILLEYTQPTINDSIVLWKKIEQQIRIAEFRQVESVPTRLVKARNRSIPIVIQASARIAKKTFRQRHLQDLIAQQLEWFGNQSLSLAERLRDDH